MMQRSKTFDRILFFLFLISVAFLIFVAGIFSAALDLPPIRVFRDAYRAGMALKEQRDMSSQVLDGNLWMGPETDTRGVTIYEPEHTWGDLTLYTSGHDNVALLIDMHGEVVHQWKKRFSEIWPDPPHIDHPTADRNIYIRRAHLASNGDIAALYETTSDSPNGYGVAKLDKDSNVIWSLDIRAHHDLHIGPSGDVAVLTHAIRKEVHPHAAHLATPQIEDFITLVGSDGKEVKQFGVYDAFVNTPFAYVLDSLSEHDLQAEGDVTHCNSIKHIPASFAAHYAGVEKGHLLVCLRSQNIVAAFDPNTRKATWVYRGIWHWPHDPVPLDNGELLIFDNMVRPNNAHFSRVLRVDPITGRASFVYKGDGAAKLYSQYRGMNELLPNGNVLITDTHGSRILEATPRGKSVWEYYNPERIGSRSAVIAGARRYQRSDLKFLQD